MPYSYQEYPKHVYPNPDDRKAFVVVNSEAEETEAMGGKKIVREEDEKRRLIALAEVKGVKVDRRWSAEKMVHAITEAGFDASLDPFA